MTRSQERNSNLIIDYVAFKQNRHIAFMRGPYYHLGTQLIKIVITIYFPPYPNKTREIRCMHEDNLIQVSIISYQGKLIIDGLTVGFRKQI